MTAALIKAAQTCRRKVPGLQEDDAWRDFAERTTGKRSLREMSAKQLGLLIEALHKVGAPKRTRPMPSSQARMAVALWIQLADLGAVRNRSQDALDSFVRRQTGLDATRWLHDPDDGRRVVEALKAWLVRVRAAKTQSQANPAEGGCA